MTGVAGLAVWLIAAQALDQDVIGQRTLLLSTLIVVGLGNVLRAAGDDRRIRWWVGAAPVVYLAVMYVPPTASFFELLPLSLSQWGLAAAVALPAAAVCWLASGGACPRRPDRRGKPGGSP